MAHSGVPTEIGSAHREPPKSSVVPYGDRPREVKNPWTVLFHGDGNKQYGSESQNWRKHWDDLEKDAITREIVTAKIRAIPGRGKAILIMANIMTKQSNRNRQEK